MIERGGIRSLQQTRAPASPQSFPHGSAFVGDAVPDQQIAGEEVDVVHGACRTLKILLARLGIFQFGSHLPNSGQEAGVGRKSLEQLLSGALSTFAHRVRSRQKAQLGIHQGFPGLRLVLEVRLQLRRSD